MSDSDFEAWLDEAAEKSFESKQRPSSNWTYKEIYQDGARAAWSKAQERSDQLLDAIKSMKCHCEWWDNGKVKEFLICRRCDALKEHGVSDAEEN